MSFQVVAGRVDEFMGAFSFSVPNLTNGYRMFFSASCVNYMFAFKLATHAHRGKYSMRRVICVLVVIFVRKLLHAVETPSEERAFV